jgi:predicted protein tyrosine phosphatase
MLNFKVFSRQNIEQYQSKNSWCLISIRDPGSNIVSINTDNLISSIYLDFYDLDQSIPGMKNCKMIDKFDAIKIIEMVEEFKHVCNTFCINCEAGESRSSGVAAALSKIYNKNDDVYFQSYCPNRLVYRTILSVAFDMDL